MNEKIPNRLQKFILQNQVIVWTIFSVFIVLWMAFIFSGCSLKCFEVGQRTCDGFLCLHPVCNGEPLTKDEIKAGINSEWSY